MQQMDPRMLLLLLSLHLMLACSLLEVLSGGRNDAVALKFQELNSSMMRCCCNCCWCYSAAIAAAAIGHYLS